ncbi:hypothetical protein PJ985_21505 [Streptomyces sp. ACA25]|nr:hypothetical protein [Streptomyces sp. ACA25]MDB1090136.1 hypothetical protein [Streptomyces sp. ACA25]
MTTQPSRKLHGLAASRSEILDLLDQLLLLGSYGVAEAINESDRN